MREIEVKILGIDVDEVSEKLIGIGAVKGFSGLIKVRYFDTEDNEICGRGDLLRIREYEGSHVEITYKTNKRVEDGFKIYDEYEFKGNDFEGACKIFESLGYKTTCLYEKKRTVFKLDNAEVVIDEYPKIAPFIEIESPDKNAIEELIVKLGVEKNERSAQSITGLLEEKYPDIELNNLIF